MANMTKEQAVKNYVENMETSELRSVVFDIYCYNGELDWLVWEDMDCLDEILGGYTPTEIAQTIYYGDFRICDDYFQFNGYGNLVSCNGYSWDKQLGEYTEDIVDALMRFDGIASDDTLQNIIDSPDEAIFNSDYECIDEDEE